MAVVVETTLGDITIDLFVEERPTTCMNFLKLCKIKYYNFCLFHSVQQNFIAQTGDPTGSGHEGNSVFFYTKGKDSKYYEAEKLPKMKHNNIGTVSMVNCGNHMLGSQFFITLGKDLQSLDGEHCVFGEVAEGHDILRKFNEVICDQTHRPYQDIRITHTVVLEDPFDDPPGLEVPNCSPELTKEVLANSRIAPDEEIDETAGLTLEEVEELQKQREAQAQATILEIVGDLPDAEVAPPENVLFVCKLNPVTTDDDLEIIFSRFGKIVSCEVIRDKNTGDSLQYAFIEFENRKACEDAYFKMDNVLIDDRRIHVDFSQSVSKLRWKGKGRLEHLDDGKPRLDYANYNRKASSYVSKSPENSRQRFGDVDSNSHHRSISRRENDEKGPRSSREIAHRIHDNRESRDRNSKYERSDERYYRSYDDSVRERYHRSRESYDQREQHSRERYRNDGHHDNSRTKYDYYERDRYRSDRRTVFSYRGKEKLAKKRYNSDGSDSEIENVPGDHKNIKYEKHISKRRPSESEEEKLSYKEKKIVKKECKKESLECDSETIGRHKGKKGEIKRSTSSESQDDGEYRRNEKSKRKSYTSISNKDDEVEPRINEHGMKKRKISEEMPPKDGKNETRKGKEDSESDYEKNSMFEGEKTENKKARKDDYVKSEKLSGSKEEKTEKSKLLLNCSYEKGQRKKEEKQKRGRDGSVSGNESSFLHHNKQKSKKRYRSNSTDSTCERDTSSRDAGKGNKKEKSTPLSSDHDRVSGRKIARHKRKCETKDESDSGDDRASKRNKVKSKNESVKRLKKSGKLKNKKNKLTKRKDVSRKKRRRKGKRHGSSSSSETSESESESDSTSSSSSSSSSSSTSDSDCSSSSVSSSSSSSSDDDRKQKRRKKSNKVNVASKKIKKGTVTGRKLKKESRHSPDVSGGKKSKEKVQWKKSETSHNYNNLEKHQKSKQRLKKRRVSSSESSTESDSSNSSEDSVRDRKRWKKTKK